MENAIVRGRDRTIYRFEVIIVGAGEKMADAMVIGARRIFLKRPCITIATKRNLRFNYLI